MVDEHPQLSVGELQALAAKFFEVTLEEAKQGRLERVFKPGEREHFLYELADIGERLRSCQDQNRLTEIKEPLDKFLADEGVDLEPSTREYIMLAQDCLSSLARINEDALDWYTSRQLKSPLQLFNCVYDRALGTAPERKRAISREGNDKLSDLTGKYLEHSRNALRPRTFEKYQANLAVCCDIIGPDTAASAIGKSDIRSLRDTLMRRPANWQKKVGADNDTAQQSIADKAHDNLLSAASINAYLTTLSSFFSWCVREGYVGSNPVSGIRVREAVHAADKRNPFTINQLNSIFSSPIFAGCHSDRIWRRRGKVIIRDERFWLPLMGLFTGLRLGELLELKSENVCEEKGIHYLKIERSKTRAGRRLVPIHQTLMDIGFRKAVPDNHALFRGVSQKAYSKFFRRFQHSVGIDDPSLVFHSFRHNFADALRIARIEEPLIKALIGHADSGVTGIYGSGYQLKELNDAIQGVRFDGLKIGHMFEEKTKETVLPTCCSHTGNKGKDDGQHHISDN